MEIHISYIYLPQPPHPHPPPVPSHFSYISRVQSPGSRVQGPLLILSLCQSLMNSQCQCMTPQRLIRAAKLRFAHWKIKILHALHNLGVKKKKRITVVVSKHTLRRSRFTLSLAYGSCLACQHFISNLISFVNLLTVFCFAMLMPTLIHAQIKKKTLQNDYHFALREDNCRTPDMLLQFYYFTKLPRNARGNIIRGKTDTFQK